MPSKRFDIKLLCLLFVAIAVVGFFITKKNKIVPRTPFIPFVKSMQRADPHFGKHFSTEKDRKKWELVEKLYNKHLSASPSATARIPKIIHQIWLGSPLPEKYHAFQKSWQEHHPDWQYRLWTDADLPAFHFSDRARFDKAENKAEQSDILRYEILYQFGGVYADTDFECLKPYDLLHHCCDFYVGMESKFPEHHDLWIGNAIIGSIAGHPILKCCLENISKELTYGNFDRIQKITGPRCLSRAFLSLCKAGNYRNVAFPFTYFYPLPATMRNQVESKEKWIYDETYGIHYWHGSWF
ncbi:MAG TPA: glycosyltransferase [Rhabdochlamydiaceae bacterium]|jgi:mannosyltransferase OCH1-like enzyme